MEMFKGYDPGKFYDEMFGADGSVRGHCAPLLRRFGQLDQNDFLARKANSELYFLRQGITFNVYHDERYVKVAVGRDYDDVAPVVGSYRGTAHCRLAVCVEVEKL